MEGERDLVSELGEGHEDICKEVEVIADKARGGGGSSSASSSASSKEEEEDGGEVEGGEYHHKILVNGYWQSYSLYQPYKQQIRDLLSLPDDDDTTTSSTSSTSTTIPGPKDIVIHIR